MEEKNEKKVYYYLAETMRSLIELMNIHLITKQDIIQMFHDGKNYVVVYEL